MSRMDLLLVIAILVTSSNCFKFKSDDLKTNSNHQYNTHTMQSSRTRMLSSNAFREVKEFDTAVNETPEFIEHPVDTLLTGTFPVRVQCLVKNARSVFMECDNIIREDVIRNVSASLESLSILIQRDDLTKEIMCRCLALTKASNNTIVSKSAIIRKSYMDKEFRTEPMDEIAYVGDTIELRCDPPRGEPRPSVYWLKNGHKLNTRSGSSRVKLSNDFSLLILMARKEDAGDYICMATNQIEVVRSSKATLVLLDKKNKYIWSDWSDWSTCESCRSMSKRYRHCQTMNKLAQIETVSISMCGNEVSFEDRHCDVPCVGKAEWSAWSQWSACSSDCKQYRRRYCHDSREMKFKDGSMEDGSCRGEKIGRRDCDLDRCMGYMTELSKVKKYDRVDKGVGETKTSGLETNFYGITLDKTSLGFSIGITSMLLVIALLITCILLVFLNRHRRRKHNTLPINKHANSELNLYYTCETNQPADDQCSLFKFTKYFKKPNNQDQFFNEKLNYPPTSQIPRLYENNMFEKSPKNDTSHIYHETTGIDHQFLLNNIKQNANLQEYLQQSNHKKTGPYQSKIANSHSNPDSPLLKSLNSTNTSSFSSNNHHHHQQQLQYTPTASIITKTSTLSSSPSSSTYYETPKTHQRLFQHIVNTQSPVREKIVLKNNSQCVNYANLSHNETVPETSEDQIYETPDQLEKLPGSGKDKCNTHHEPHHSTNYSKINSTNFLSNSNISGYNLDPRDLCVAHLTPSGAKLTLDCGISLIVPEGALHQPTTIYLAICRAEVFKPRLNEKSTLISEVILVGPNEVTLLKPVVLIVDHCVKSVENWSINLHSNKTDHSSSWHDTVNINNDNSHNFVNVTDRNFFMLTNKLGRFVFTGEAIRNRACEKYLRLVVFCSTSITSNDFNMRIYCVDNLLSALQEVLGDEKKIGGVLLDASEPFLVGQAVNESLRISIEDLMPQSLICKYNVNKQEIPLSHIWSGTSHLLHCSFAVQRNDMISREFRCQIKAGFVDQTRVYLNIAFDLGNLFDGSRVNEVNEMNLITMDRSRCWLKASKLIYCQNLVNDFYRLNNQFKSQVCSALDGNQSDSSSWTLLAHCLAIHKNLHYFTCKQSPTSFLILYLEAISEIRACELNGLNYEHYVKEIAEVGENSGTVDSRHLCLPVTQNHEAVFQQALYFLDNVKTNFT